MGSRLLQLRSTSLPDWHQMFDRHGNKIALSLKRMLRHEGVGGQTYIVPVSDFIIGEF